uniref:CHK domain-containing protein n=1 Tax=Heterorhabditis bacteriophora TaxID=37862 RepID=A0A1I7XFZ4_HETBA
MKNDENWIGDFQGYYLILETLNQSGDLEQKKCKCNMCYYFARQFMNECINSYIKKDFSQTNSPEFRDYTTMMISMNQMLINEHSELANCLTVLHDKVIQKKSWYEDYMNTYQAEDMISVYTHGDLWAPQILWKNGCIHGIVDWALCHPGSLEDYKSTLPYTCAQSMFAAAMWSHSTVLLKGGKDDKERIKEITMRLKSIVEETINSYQWI